MNTHALRDALVRCVEKYLFETKEDLRASLQPAIQKIADEQHWKHFRFTIQLTTAGVLEVDLFFAVEDGGSRSSRLTLTPSVVFLASE